MVTVTLGRLNSEGARVEPEPTPVPRRFRLDAAAIAELARLTEASLPEEVVGDSVADPAGLRRAGLLLDDELLHPEVVDAMTVFGNAEVEVGIELVVGRGHLRAWHRLNGQRVTALAAAGTIRELCWYDDDSWQRELARTIDVTPPDQASGPPLPQLTLPYEVLLASAESVESGRDELTIEFAHRGAGIATGPEGPLTAAALHTQLIRLHRGTVGRLLVTVGGRQRDGDLAAGWVSWTLFADGWRSLTPLLQGGERMVSVRRVDPLELGRQVARLVMEVRS